MMNHIKLFEAYSAEEYQKVLFKVKDFIQKDKPKDEILSLINKYASDDIKKLDGIRLIVDRINKNYHSHYVFHNRREVTKGKKIQRQKVFVILNCTLCLIERINRKCFHFLITNICNILF